jgi:hypothetical protein
MDSIDLAIKKAEQLLLQAITEEVKEVLRKTYYKLLKKKYKNLEESSESSESTELRKSGELKEIRESSESSELSESGELTNRKSRITKLLTESREPTLLKKLSVSASVAAREASSKAASSKAVSNEVTSRKAKKTKLMEKLEEAMKVRKWIK